MAKPLLSICIPSYARQEHIRKTIESFRPKQHAEIEIVVTDDASPDNTPQILKQLENKYPNLRVIYNSKNLHLDRNVIKVIGQAKGDYCWLFGDDDYVKPAAVKQITKLLKEHKPSLLLSNYARFNNQTGEVTSPMMIKAPTKTYSDSETFFFQPTPNSYFPLLGVNLIFMSILIGKRSLWLKAIKNTPKKFLESNYFHTFSITQLITQNPNILFYQDPLVMYRDANIRPWRNRDIWGYYRNAYLEYCHQLGWSSSKLQRAKLLLWLDHHKKRGIISKIHHKSVILRKSLGLPAPY